MDKTLLATTRSLLYKNGRLLTSNFEDKSTVTSRGYRQLYVGGKPYLLHRLIWLFFHGKEPEVVDHVNGDVYDNRIENLQDCTQSVNIAKSKLFNTNKTGYRGVHYNKNAGKYESYVWIDSKKHYCGLHNTPVEAYNSRIEYLGRRYGKD